MYKNGPRYGLNHVTYLIEQSKAQFAVIAHDIDPVELVVWLPDRVTVLMYTEIARPRRGRVMMFDIL